MIITVSGRQGCGKTRMIEALRAFVQREFPWRFLGEPVPRDLRGGCIEFIEQPIRTFGDAFGGTPAGPQARHTTVVEYLGHNRYRVVQTDLHGVVQAKLEVDKSTLDRVLPGILNLKVTP